MSENNSKELMKFIENRIGKLLLYKPHIQTLDANYYNDIMKDNFEEEQISQYV